MKKWILIVGLLPQLGCVKDKPLPVQPAPGAISSGKRILVLNEGNFGASNAEVGIYDPATQVMLEDVYRTQNNQALGDVLQSIAFINRKFYLVVNNSGKIVVTDRDLKKLDEIAGLRSPRYICQAGADRAWVSDLYEGKLTFVDLGSQSVTGKVPCKGWTEAMLSFGKKTYVCNFSSQYLYVLDNTVQTIVDSVWVGEGAGSLQLDRNDKLWVLCGGDGIGNTDSRLSRIDPAALKVEFSQSLKGSGAMKLCMNQNLDSLFFLHQDVYAMPIAASSLPAVPLIYAGKRNFYGLGVDPDNSEIYLSDALDYSQRSNIYRYSATGVEISVFKAGVNASGFYFD